MPHKGKGTTEICLPSGSLSRVSPMFRPVQRAFMVQKLGQFCSEMLLPVKFAQLEVVFCVHEYFKIFQLRRCPGDGTDALDT